MIWKRAGNTPALKGDTPLNGESKKLGFWPPSNPGGDQDERCCGGGQGRGRAHRCILLGLNSFQNVSQVFQLGYFTRKAGFPTPLKKIKYLATVSLSHDNS